MPPQKIQQVGDVHVEDDLMKSSLSSAAGMTYCYRLALEVSITLVPLTKKPVGVLDFGVLQKTSCA